MADMAIVETNATFEFGCACYQAGCDLALSLLREEVRSIKEQHQLEDKPTHD